MAFVTNTSITLFFIGVCTLSASADLIGLSDWPYDGDVGTAGSLAVPKDSPDIIAWATGYENYVQGSPVSAGFGDPVNGLGFAEGNSYEVVTLGNGGRITLTFATPIRNNGTGPDFAVFENGFSNSFLELAWVEVSSDGVHFVRFPNYSFTNSQADGGSLDPRDLHGYASKYRQGYGTPFDLDQLRLAFEAASVNPQEFSTEFQQQLMSNYSELDLERITHVRLIDIVGDGSSLDSANDPFTIFDPLNSSGAAGFDLDAVAVLNQVDVTGESQSLSFPPIQNRRISDGSLRLQASSSSGLPLEFEVLEGPAVVNGDTLSFTGLGRVVIQANQSGDLTYAPAIPVTQSFYVADEVQHIFFEPVANQLTNSSVDLNLYTTSGLFPLVEIISGPDDATTGFPPNISLFTGDQTGTLVLRAYQVGGVLGGVTYAPPEDVIMTVEVVEAGSPDAPQSFGAWQTANSLSGDRANDSDMDGASDFEEYLAGSDPSAPSDRPVYLLEQVGDGGDYVLEATVSRLASVRLSVQANDDLSNPNGWGDVIPEVESIEIPEGAPQTRKMRLRVKRDGDRQFWRFDLEEN